MNDLPHMADVFCVLLNWALAGITGSSNDEIYFNSSKWQQDQISL